MFHYLLAGLARPAIVLIVGLMALAAAITPVSAQEATPIPDSVTFAVAAVVCEDVDCTQLGDRVAGVNIWAEDVFTTEVVDQCTTDGASQTQGCTLTVPYDVTFVLQIDPAQIPDGYRLFERPFDVKGGPGPTVTYLGFVPIAAEQPAVTPTSEPPVKALPSTGSGEAESVSLLLPLASGGVLLGLAVAARWHLRRR